MKNKEIEKVFNTKLYFDLEEEDYIKIKNYIEQLEKVSDERMNTILKIEKYCIDEKEDLIAGSEVCEDILKFIDILKGSSDDE